MNKSLLIISLFVAVGALGIWYAARQKPAQNMFTVGTASGYAPFVSIDVNGNYEGFDIDVAQAIAQQLTRNLVIKDLGSMSALFMALEQGSIDAIMWGLSITQDRLKKVTMIPYQGETTATYPLLFWEQIPTNIASINDMEGKTISVEAASVQDAVLSKYPTIQKQVVDKIDDALLNIQYGKTDAALVEPAIARKFQKKYTQIKVMPVVLALEDQEQGIGIALKKNNGKLQEEVRQAVKTLQQEKTITQLEEKWNLS